MRQIRVPAPHREPIRQLARLSDEQFEALRAALSRVNRHLARGTLSQEIVDALHWDDVPAASLLLDALLGAHSVLQRREAQSDEVADAIARDSSLKLTPDEQSVASIRLLGLLQIEPLAALSRAVLLVLDDQTFCTARTFSDIRPVFTVNPGTPETVGAVIRHTLLIRYHADGPETKPFSLNVDKDGLRALKDAVDRALDKDVVLRQVTEAIGMRIIDVEDTH